MHLELLKGVEIHRVSMSDMTVVVNSWRIRHTTDGTDLRVQLVWLVGSGFVWLPPGAMDRLLDREAAI